MSGVTRATVLASVLAALTDRLLPIRVDRDLKFEPVPSYALPYGNKSRGRASTKERRKPTPGKKLERALLKNGKGGSALGMKWYDTSAHAQRRRDNRHARIYG